MKRLVAPQKLILALALALLPIYGTSAQLLAQSNLEPSTQPEIITNDPSLISPETGVNYNSLSTLLTKQEWRQANDKTRALMLQATEREDQGWFSTQDLEKFPCWDLKTIDNLWKQYSNSRFGFSVQFPIFIDTGNRPGRLVAVDAYEKFGDQVGWRKQEEWIQFKGNLIYNLDAPVGHLPNPRSEYQITGGRLEYTTLTTRILACELVSSGMIASDSEAYRYRETLLNQRSPNGLAH